MDSKLTAEQEKLAALIESDYALLKFGYYGTGIRVCCC